MMNIGMISAVFITVLVISALDPSLQRLAEEADVFTRTLDKVIGEETIRQKSLKRPAWFRFRIGESSLRENDPEYQERTLDSEFAYALFREDESDDGSWHEVRQVLRVDERSIRNREKARKRMVLGLKSENDLLKRSLLDELTKRGLPQSATDFSLCLLLFRTTNLQNFAFTPTGIQSIGADPALVYQFTQQEGAASFTVFHGKKVIHQPLSGEVWIRQSDGLPLKIRLTSRIETQGKPDTVDIGEVEYARSRQGDLLPVSVMHRRTSGELLVAENHFTYSNFRRFSADSEIKFTPEDSTPPQ